MTFSIRGDYFEACTCAVSCPCIFLSPATGDTCDLLFAWHVDEGAMDDVSLDGLNVVMAVRSPKQMSDGGWTAALYLDERASGEQSGALGAIFSGQAGGHLANVAPLIGTVAGVWPAPISWVAEPHWLQAPDRRAVVRGSRGAGRRWKSCSGDSSVGGERVGRQVALGACGPKERFRRFLECGRRPLSTLGNFQG